MRGVGYLQNLSKQSGFMTSMYMYMYTKFTPYCKDMARILHFIQYEHCKHVNTVSLRLHELSEDIFLISVVIQLSPCDI